jgi:N6-adenosine-specific RNA methylase IME4
VSVDVFSELSPPYATIVADPPWPYPEGWPGWGMTAAERRALPYTSMTVDEIAALPVRSLAAREGYLFLWTTNRYLRASFDVLDAWGFTFRQAVVWCKDPQGEGPGGMFAQTTEYVMVAQNIGPRSHARGKRTSGSREASSWFKAPKAAHSAKPPSFMDAVERVAPGPYLELFCRQPRFGWDTWGWGHEFGEAS